MQHKGHSSVYIGFLIGAWISLLLTFLFNALSFYDSTTLKLGIFQSTVSEISDATSAGITPTDWAFMIWMFIYAYQTIWMIYATANVFRSSADGTPLYVIAPFIHWSNFPVYIINTLSSVAWLLLWDRAFLAAAFVFLFLTASSLYINISITIYGIHKYHPVLSLNGFRNEHRLVFGIPVNAFAMYATWTTFATLINLTTVLVSYVGIIQVTSVSISLSVLTIILMVWFMVDIGILEKYTRFLWTPYGVLVVALSGVIDNNYVPGEPNSILTVALLVVSIVMFVVKVALVVYREMKDPVFKKDEVKVNVICN